MNQRLSSTNVPRAIAQTQGFAITILIASLAGCQGTTPPATSTTAASTPSPRTTTTVAAPMSPRPIATSPAAVPSVKPLSVPSKVANPSQPCQISAYVTDPDPKGVNIRSAPNSNSEIIGKLPKVLSTIVDISAAQGDWVQITKADSAGKIAFSGKGWVYASLLGTSTRGYGSKGVEIYTSASDRSSVIGKIPHTTNTTLLSCDGFWAKVSYQQTKGWLQRSSQCPSDLTTCP